MTNKELNIKYICSYDVLDNTQDRYYEMSAVTKIDYICETIISLGYKVSLISASHTKNKKKCFPGVKKRINNNITLRLFPTCPRRNILLKIISGMSMKMFLLIELLKLKEDDIVIVYHSLSYMVAVYIAHKIKKFHLIYEVEEIYSDVINKRRLFRWIELAILSDSDKYIFSTEMLNDTVNKRFRDYLIINGIYKTEEKRMDITQHIQFEKGIIHCVYAGNLEPRKGAYSAIASAQFLPNNYHIHIIGAGDNNSIGEIRKYIKKIQGLSTAKVTYDGFFKGEEYVKYVQSCHIGLCTQRTDADYNDTSFPSKILSYLANGLRVVSIDIPAIRMSNVSELLYFCADDSATEISKAICGIDVNDKTYNSKKRLNELSEMFRNNLANILNY